MSRIEHLLRESIGLDAASIGSSAIQRAVRLRMQSLGVNRAEDYKRRLQTSPQEWTELVESVVVTETWFFRDQEPFAALVRLVQSERLSTHPTAPLRLLSLPCSSGEEPYSLAMTLLDAGVPSEHFCIDALDISSRALAKAQRGVYGRNSFRGQELGFRARWFQPVKEGYALAPTVRRCVRFQQANVLEAGFLADQPAYDFVFCRNLLIYFDAPTRRKALGKMQRLLLASGVLFVGAAELPLVLEHGFVSANLPMAFACRKAAAAGSTVPTEGPVRAGQAVAPSILNDKKGRSAPCSEGVDGAVAAARPSDALLAGATQRRSDEPPLPPEAHLEAARRLADAGQLTEAAAVCEAYLKRCRDSAPGWYLLGLVREAAGEATAGDCYHKALYLEPDHYESLLQMALLAEKNGDAARARTYRRRAERSRNRSQATSS